MTNDQCVGGSSMYRFVLVFGGAATLASLVLSAAVDVVKVDGGQISGTAALGVRVFKGIPFAAPPVGDLRWAPPQPVARWNGVRPADTFGAECVQEPYPPGSPYARPVQHTSEDC